VKLSKTFLEKSQRKGNSNEFHSFNLHPKKRKSYQEEVSATVVAVQSVEEEGCNSIDALQIVFYIRSQR